MSFDSRKIKNILMMSSCIKYSTYNLFNELLKDLYKHLKHVNDKVQFKYTWIRQVNM